MSAIAHPARATASGSELRRGWPVIAACFAVAVFGWGFGFYGQSVFLAELQRLHHWSASLTSSATTVYYLFGALALAFVHRGFDRFGPRAVLGFGAIVLGAGAVAVSRAQTPWQLYAGGLVMGIGWACTSGTAIATTIALWFDRARGLAISLALNGASASGFLVAPVLVHFSHSYGLAATVTAVALVLLAVLLPIIVFAVASNPSVVSIPAARRGTNGSAVSDSRPGFASQAEALRDIRFWSVAAPFALALVAQVGFILHQVAFLLPHLGPDGTGLAVACLSVASMTGRIGLGLVIDRLDQRLTSAATFALQVAALLLMMALPEWPAALYLGCVLFGLSVGNVITLPALIVQREFAGYSFGLVIALCTAVGQVAYAFAPALLGIVHDMAGGYGPALGLCAALEVAAAIMILPRGKRVS
jgi:MFS family permease